MKRILWVVAGGLTLALVALVAVTSNSSKDTNGGPTEAIDPDGGAGTAEPGLPIEDWARDGSSSDDMVRAEAKRVFESFAGTVDQRDALAVVRAFEANKSTDECMAAAGFEEWDWSLARIYADPEDPLKTNIWLAEPLGPWRSQDLLAAKPFLLAEAQMNDDDLSDEEVAASQVCTEVQASEPTKLSDEAPRIAERLSDEWWTMVQRYRPTGMPDDLAYVACMDEANPELLEGFGVAEVGPAMSAASPPDEDIPSDPEDASQWNAPGWQRFLALEHEYLAADWACREDVYEAHIGGLAPQIAAFETQHGADIEQASEAWKSLERTAKDIELP